jgi:hypothetical protein
VGADGAGGLFGAILAGGENAFTNLKLALVGASGFGGQVSEIMAGVQNAFTNLKLALVGASGFGGQVSEITAGVTTQFTNLTSALFAQGGPFPSIVSGASATITKLGTTLQTTIADLYGVGSGVLANAWGLGTKILGAVAQGIQEASNAVWTALRDKVNDAINAFNRSTSSITISLPDTKITIAGVSQTIVWPTIGPFSLPKLPLLDTGALVLRPTIAALAQNGVPEAVIPLSGPNARQAQRALGATYNLTIHNHGEALTPERVLRALRRLELLHAPFH